MLELLQATQTGNYPAGTTAEALAEIVLDKTFSACLKNRRFWKAPMVTTALHLAAWEGHLPPGTTAQALINAKDNLGFTALHAAASAGVLPPETTVPQLIQTRGGGGFSALHFVPFARSYFKGVTVKDLINSKSDFGWSALHASAGAGNLLAGTTLHDLMHCKDGFDNPALAELPKEFGYRQMKPVLDATTVSSAAELKELGTFIARWNPAAAALWMANELRRLKSPSEKS
jgi:hypothetical protein